MRHLVFMTIMLVSLFSSCGGKEQPKEQQSLMEASKQELVAALEERDQLLDLVKDMSVSMEQIKHLEKIMTVAGARSDEGPAQRARLLRDMADVREALRIRRGKLAELEARLQKSSLYTDKLKSIVDALRKQIDSQTNEVECLRDQLSRANEKINSLNREVDSLTGTVATVSRSLDETQAASVKLENELNACYYVVASKAQLKEHKIIETRFLRKSKLMKGDFDKGFFVVGDKRNLKTVEIGSRRVKIYTNHPEDSYEVINAGKNKILTITDPVKFWSLTNYLVIQID